MKLKFCKALVTKYVLPIGSTISTKRFCILIICSVLGDIHYHIPTAVMLRGHIRLVYIEILIRDDEDIDTE